MDSNDRSRYLRAGSADNSAEPALFCIFPGKIRKIYCTNYYSLCCAFLQQGYYSLKGCRSGSITIPAALFFVFAETLKISSRRNAMLFSITIRDSRQSNKLGVAARFYRTVPSIMLFVILNSSIVLSRPVKQSVSTTSPSGYRIKPSFFRIRIL